MADPRDPPFGVRVLPETVSATDCADWVACLARQPHEPVQIIDHQKSTPAQVAYRRDPSRVTERVDPGPIRQAIEDVIRSAVTTQISQDCGRDFAWFIGPQVLRYNPGGFYKRHADSDHWSAEHSAWVKGLDRDISLLIYLNDDFSRGELNFPHFNYLYRPCAGDLIFFPSDFRYLHQALPVESGTRYVIASWAAFAGEPRVRDKRPDNRIDLDY